MLTSEREKWITERCEFGWVNTSPLIFFDACTATESNKTTKLYNDGEFHDYLKLKGPSANLLPPENSRERLRLAFCERRHFYPPDFCMSREAFVDIESEFQLPRATIPVFAHQGGSHAYSFGYDGGEISSLALVVKLPQLFQIGNWGMSLHYSFSTRSTNALIWGWNVINDDEHLTRRQVTPIFTEFERLLSESSASLWHEPLLLPVIFLELYHEHLTRFISKDIARYTSELEGDLGVQSARNFVNESHAMNAAVNAAARMVEHMSDGRGRAEITSKLNTTSFNAICVIANIKWAQRYVQTVNDISKELDDLSQPQDKNKSEVKQTLQLLTNKLSSTQEYVDQIKARLDLQLAMLTNYSTQADNDQNIKIADQNLKIARDMRVDSLAMKALAVVTVVFLPPSLIATIFSMSMFDWQAPGSQIVTYKFWVYWAVSVPLAIILIVLWLMWWNWQKSQYDKDYHAVKTSASLTAYPNGKNA